MRRRGADSSNCVRIAPLVLAICLANLRDLVQVRHRSVRIHGFTHQPPELKEIRRHPIRATQVVLRTSVLPGPAVYLDLRHASAKLTRKGRKILVEHVRELVMERQDVLLLGAKRMTTRAKHQVTKTSRGR